jgi:hypothetical protein
MMKSSALAIGMKVRHPQYGEGVVKAITEHTAEVLFSEGRKTIEPETSGVQPAEAQVAISGLETPLQALIERIVGNTVSQLRLERPEGEVQQLGQRWHGGKLVLHPADASLQTKELPIEVFFHKIIMVRNNLRVLEQKINAHEKLSDAEKVEMQQYITRSYGSLTTFNLLFRNKEDQFSGASGKE